MGQEDVKERDALLRSWLIEVLGEKPLALSPASADASFRRYWRVQVGNRTWIAMDAPPGREDCGRYVRLARLLRAYGVQTPEVHAEDLSRGFLLISDLGDQVYLSALNDATADRLYGDALETLLLIQTRLPQAGLPEYDAPFLQRELGLFRTWLVEGLLGLELMRPEYRQWEGVEALLIANALEQPRVFVHRDYHSRNLMLTERENPGVLDFQDAVSGPLTYDLVSLLRDCYIAWDPERVWGWALDHYDRLCSCGRLVGVDEQRFRRWFDLMGAQRHLKAAGIFARLSLRDGKHGYLADIPRTLGYVIAVCGRHPELAAFGEWLQGRILPALAHLVPVRRPDMDIN
ncbi:phosphotransferase [Caldichromatium japonicum]|uniref:Phosphotransferase n=2 Tax=Caldichromatium japonicum TaxID=2699430 RepID=A0A6G7VGQ2_9GAMM|nr:phosphotransferase [Caldichromatium japonicum]